MKKHILYIALAVLMTACSEDTTLDLVGMFSPNGEVVNQRFEQRSEDFLLCEMRYENL